MLEKTLDSSLDSKEIKPVNPKGNQPWIFSGRTDAEAEAPILWPPDVKSWLIWKDRDAGKDWGQEEKGMTEDEMVGWHHWLDGHESEQALGVGDGQGGLVCCDSCGRKESDTTEQLIWSDGLRYPVLHYLSYFAQTHVHWVKDAIQPSHPLLPTSPPALNLSQHQGLFQWIGALHKVARVLELQLQHQSFQWIFRVDFL